MDGDAESLTEFSGGFQPASRSEGVRRQRPFTAKWKERAQRLQKEAHVFYFVFKHPDTRWYVRIVSLCTAGYLLSPIQLIPNYIPVIGVLDDVLVVFLGAKLVQRMTPARVLTECRELADAAEVRRIEQIKSTAAIVGSIAIATAWFVAAIIGSVLMVGYLRH
jgi:uncharacterized membrane protein YkvA (DUF1232 family)